MKWPHAHQGSTAHCLQYSHLSPTSDIIKLLAELPTKHSGLYSNNAPWWKRQAATVSLPSSPLVDVPARHLFVTRYKALGPICFTQYDNFAVDNDNGFKVATCE